MKNDKKIREKMQNLIVKAEKWLSFPNNSAATDRILEDIIDEAKEIEKLHEERFEVNNLKATVDKNIVYKLIITLNNTKKFDCYDIDNPVFIDYICDKSGLDRITYKKIMGL